jgi:hypothetical protein
MKRTVIQIIETISEKAKRLRDNAAYGGAHSDGGASKLEKNLGFFVLGFKAGGNTDLNTEVEVPTAWTDYFFRQDPEYNEYLRLKSKFNN